MSDTGTGKTCSNPECSLFKKELEPWDIREGDECGLCGASLLISDVIDETTPAQQAALSDVPGTILPDSTFHIDLPITPDIETTLEHAGVKAPNGIINGFTDAVLDRSDDPISREVQKYDLFADSVAAIRENFQLDLAPQWKEQALAIIVTDASQTALIKQAHDTRIQLRDERVRIEKVRKVLKERPLREGKAIDAVANLLKGIITPVEEHLLTQEQYAARLEADKRAKLQESRAAELAPYVESTDVFALGSISEEQYQMLLNGAIATKAEKERVEAERLEAEEKEKQAAARKLARVNQLSALGFRWNTDYPFYEYEDLVVDVSSIDNDTDEQWAERVDGLTGKVGDINDAKNLADAKAASDRAELERIEAERVTKENEAKALALAPDKDKLVAYFKSVHDATALRPALESEGARLLLDRYFDAVADLTNNFAREADELA